MHDMIAAYLGANNAGKTLSLFRQEVLPWLRKGRPVLSNTPVFASPADIELPWQERAVHPLYVPLVSWRQLSQRLGDTLVVLDEISSTFDSRDSGRMPSQITSRFQQLRKDDNKVVWSAPDWSFCDIRLRRVTRAVNLCSGHWSKKVEGREWRTNRLFKVRQYERADYDEFSEGQALSTRKETPRPASKIRYWRTRDEAQHYYSTYAPVELLDHLDDSGKCIDCGGKRAPHKCECTIVDRPRRQPEPMTIGEMKSYALSLVPELRFGGIDLSYLVDAPHPPLTAVMSDQRCTSDA